MRRKLCGEFAWHKHTRLSIVLGLAAFYFPTVWFGYRTSDFTYLHMSFAEAWNALFEDYFRPVWLFSFPITSSLSDAASFQHLINVILLALMAFVFLRILSALNLSPAWAVAAFTHPAFSWSVGWISQRNDLLLILFLLLACVMESKRYAILWLALSDLSKTPFVFQNLVFAIKWGNDRRWVSSPLAIVAFVAILGFSWWIAREGLLAGSKLPAVDAGVMGTMILRAIKSIEGIVYVLVPFPASYGTALMWIVVPAYLGLWAFCARVAWKQRGNLMAGLMYAAITLMMCVPFGVSSELRVVAPAVPFLYLFVAQSSRLWPSSISLALAFASVNIVAMVGNYQFSDTNCYQLNIPTQLQERCRPSDMPNDVWMNERGDIIARWIAGRHR